MTVLRIALLVIVLGLLCGQGLADTLPAASTSAAVPITYTLAKACRVSMAIYDKDGVQIRTLRNAEPQSAGPHTVYWDGLDSDAKPAPAGPYRWKLLSGLGLKSEYLFTLGISTRDVPWPGNHGATVALDTTGDEVICAAIAAEGSCQLVKMSQAGDVKVACQPGGSIEDISRVGNLTYIASTEMAHLGVLNSTTGEAAWWSHTLSVPTVAVVKSVTRPGPTSVKGSLNYFKYDVPNNGGWMWYLGTAILHNSKDQPINIKLGTSVSYGQPIPLKDLTLKPNESVTVDLGHVVVYGDTNEQFIFTVDGDSGWVLDKLDMIAPSDRVAAFRGPAPTTPPGPNADWATSNNQVWVGNTRAGIIQLVEPTQGGKVLREVHIPGFQDIAFTRDGQLLAISGHTVCLVNGDNLQPVISDLDDPRRLAVDNATGDLFIADWGAHNQIRKYNAAYQLQHVYGREGGRAYGLYKPENFSHVDDVAGDGHGGFFVAENWGARRVAHFTTDGVMLREWYGGQGFQQYIAQDSKYPDRIWLCGMFNTDVIECEVDWAKRDWHVRSVYNLAAPVDKAFGGLNYMPVGMASGRPHTVYRDIDGDGKPERLMWIEDNPGLLLRIDEANGRLVPLAASGFIMDATYNMLQKGTATDSDRIRFAALFDAFTLYPKDAITPRYWTWADTNGDGLVQTGEMQLYAGTYGWGTYPGGLFVSMNMDQDLTLTQRSGWGLPPGGPSWYVMKAQGYTKCGAPIWRMDKRTRSNSPDGVAHALTYPDGSSYEVKNTDGEGYIANGVSRVGGQGAGWPSTLAGGTQVCRRDASGRVLWVSGFHAPVQANDPGQLHGPVRVAGVVKNCVGVGDHVCNPLAMWTTDGLYMGDLFDRPANNGLPHTAYAWGAYDGPIPPGKDRGYFFDHLALTQYDMVANGLLSTNSKGEVFYMSCGFNGAPCYRITGWEDLGRQTGQIKLQQPVVKQPEDGTGLSATYYSLPELKGEATQRLDPQVWFGMKASVAKKPWPLPDITAKPFSAVWEGYIQPRLTETGRLLIDIDQDERGAKTPLYRMRLYVNGKLELDDWDKRDWLDVHIQTRFLDFKAGERVPVRLEYSCSKPCDELGLCWVGPSTEVRHIPTTNLYPK